MKESYDDILCTFGKKYVDLKVVAISLGLQNVYKKTGDAFCMNWTIEKEFNSIPHVAHLVLDKSIFCFHL